MEVKYILGDRVPIPCLNPLVWWDWMQVNDRTIAETLLGDRLVRTSFVGESEPFETLVLGPPRPTRLFGREATFRPLLHKARHATWDEAVAGHKAITLIPWP